MELERDQFEEVALAHFVAQRAAGVQISGDNGCEPTRESLFWRDENGNYGVLMFNAAWWGWKEAAIATRKTCEVPSLDEANLAQGEGMPEPSQAQPPAPGEAAREYMTGYSDCKEWAGATNQALVGALTDATQSLETISMLAGRKTYGNPPLETFMETFSEVRGYAISRAGVGREAIAAAPQPKEPK